MKYLAIVNLGSNSVRMAVYRIDSHGNYQEVKRAKSDSRLSARMGPQRFLQPQAVNRTLRALKSFRQIYSRYPNVTVISLATAAVRQARNRHGFLKRVKREVGTSVRVLSGTQEARYDYLGVKDHVNVPEYLVMDAGGGSLELVGVKDNHCVPVSLPLGAVNISERYRLDDVISGKDWFLAQTALAKWLNRVPWLNRFAGAPFVLLGGAHCALARMAFRQRSLASQAYLDGRSIDRSKVDDVYRQLLGDNLAQRKLVTGLESDRASVIIGGLLPLVTLLNRLNTDRVIFSSRGVRQGVIKQFIENSLTSQ